MKRTGSILAAAFLAAACGKKANPIPPLPARPARTTGVVAEQEGMSVEVTFPYPSLRADGAALTDLMEIRLYRVVDPSPDLVKAPAAPGGSPGIGFSADRAPNTGERRRAGAARSREQSFIDAARKIAVLSPTVAAARTRGASVVYRDSLREVLESKEPPRELGYAIVTVRRNGEQSEISNTAVVSVSVPPAAPTNLLAIGEENRICLSWTAPDGDISGRPVEIEGYRVYRRLLEEDEFEEPLSPRSVAVTSFADSTAAYNHSYIYTVTAMPKGHENSEGLPAIGIGISYRDVFPPPPVERLDALPEEKLVRLLWSPVSAPDLAGYNVYRAAGNGPKVKLNPQPISENTFIDDHVEPGAAYAYEIRAIDGAGNESAASPAASARPYTAN